MSTATWFLLGLGALGLLLKYFLWRSDQKDAAEHADEIAVFAQKIGGKVTEDPSPWSADLAPAFVGEHDGVMGLLNVASGPQFDNALEFERDGWLVRVSEATAEVRSASSDGTNTDYEFRVEVATADVVPMKIVIGRYAEFKHQRKWAAGMPQSVAGQERPLWMELSPPESADHAHLVFTSDLVEADGLLNAQAIAWLQGHDVKELVRVTFEAGIAYTSVGMELKEKYVLPVVDELVDLLNRIPGARPQHQAA